MCAGSYVSATAYEHQVAAMAATASTRLAHTSQVNDDKSTAWPLWTFLRLSTDALKPEKFEPVSQTVRLDYFRGKGLNFAIRQGRRRQISRTVPGHHFDFGFWIMSISPRAENWK